MSVCHRCGGEMERQGALVACGHPLYRCAHCGTDMLDLSCEPGVVVLVPKRYGKPSSPRDLALLNPP